VDVFDILLIMARALSAAPTVTIPIRDGITEGGLIVIGILVIVIVALAVVGLVILKFGSQINSRMKAVQEQVANDHKHADGTPINLRDDLDGKHDENAKKLDKTLAIVTTMQRDIAFLMRRSIEQDDRIEDLEDTGGLTRRSRRNHEDT
jgi:hypothetical protein